MGFFKNLLQGRRLPDPYVDEKGRPFRKSRYEDAEENSVSAGRAEDPDDRAGSGEEEGVINARDLLDSAFRMGRSTPRREIQAISDELDAMEKIVDWFDMAVKMKKYAIMGHNEDDDSRYTYGFIDMKNETGYDFGMFSVVIQVRYSDGSDGRLKAVVHDWKNGEPGELIFDWPDKDPVGMTIDVQDISYKDRKKPATPRYASRYTHLSAAELRREADALMRTADALEDGAADDIDTDVMDDIDLDNDPDLDADLDPDDLDDESSGGWDREETIAKAMSYMEGTGYYDTSDALTAVEAWIYSLDEEPDDGELYNQCINELDMYDNYEYYENVPSRYR